MSRISRDEMLMEMAEVVAKRGTCSRLQVGAIFSREGRVISTGYNGVPAGLPHCNHDCDCGAAYKYGVRAAACTGDCASQQPCIVAEHAERNGIAFAAKHGLALDKSELHVTHAPCWDCSRSIINAGIQRILFTYPYRKLDGVELLASANIEVVGPLNLP